MDPAAEPSLFLAEQQHIAQREHIHNHNQHHQHHRSLHKRQSQPDDGVEVVSVVKTVSVVQQIDIDSNGNTVSTLYTPTPDPDLPPILTEDSSIATPGLPSPSNTIPSGANTGAANTQVPLTGSPASTPASTVPPTSSPSPASSQASTPSTAFPSLTVGSNSTALISGSSSLSPNSSNNSTSTISSNASSTSKLSRTSLTSSTLSNDASITSISDFLSSSSPDPTSGGFGGFIVGGTGVTSSASSSSTSGSGSNGGSHSTPATPTPVIVGSVVSSIAGVAILVAILLFLWRWRQKKKNMLPLGNGDSNTTSIRAPPSAPAPGMMVERRSFVNAVPAALANLTGMKRFSERTDTGTISSTAGSERGFYKVSGRKIESVLTSGGDGWGGGERVPPSNPFEDRANTTMSATSWYSDADGITGGPGVTGPTSPLTRLEMPLSGARDSGIPVSRPSPARTPVIEHGPFTQFRGEGRSLTRPDGVGRSHPSQDGSHASRFQEEV